MFYLVLSRPSAMKAIHPSGGIMKDIDLQAGKLSAEDLSALEAVIERTDEAARQLRGGIVE